MENLGLLYSCLFQFLLHFPSLFIKSIQFFKCIIQNSWQNFFFSQNLKFFKISPWNFIFSCKFKLSPLCMNEEKWKKCWEIKLGLLVTITRGVGHQFWCWKLRKLKTFHKERERHALVLNDWTCHLLCILGNTWPTVDKISPLYPSLTFFAI